MGEQSEQCPTCGKPVMGRTALLAHLEFSHSVADPDEFLDALETADRVTRDWRPALKWGGVAIACLALVAGAFLAVGAGGDADVDAAEAASTADTSAPPTTEAPTTTAPSTTTSTTSTVPPTTAPPTTLAPEPTSDSDLVAADFRKPFLRDAHVVLCQPSGDSDIYRVGFTLSGARDIVLDGDEYPGSSGDGLHVVDHPIPEGSDTYVDEIVVADGDGTEYPVPVTPPLYLGSC